MEFFGLKKGIKQIIFLFVILFVLELTVFNFRYWQSRNYQEITVERTDFSVGEGLQAAGDGYRVVDQEKAYVRFDQLNFHVNNIYVDLSNGDGAVAHVKVGATDAANVLAPIDLGETEIVESVPQTQYIDVHLNGKSDQFVLWFQDENAVVVINEIAFNRTVPFHFSWIRLGALFAIGIFLILFSPKNGLYQISLMEKSTKKTIPFLFCILLQIVIILCVGHALNPDEYYGDWWPANMEYEELTDALLDRQVYLHRSAPESLKQCVNPYDPYEREVVTTAAGERELAVWDYAYYNGRFYSYFGVVPAILFFAPVKLLTGHHLATWNLVMACTIAYCVACYWFIYEICKRWFRQASYGLYLLLSVFFSFASSIIYLVYQGVVYSVPIITSLLFGVIGLSFWLSARSGNALSKGRLFVGAAFIALIMGCRPQLVLICLLAVPIFWEETVKERLFFSRKGVANTICVVLPFLLVGCMVMYYNQLRFGSPFDFGAAYNLTSNDMTHKGWVWERIPLGVFCYCLMPSTVSAKFPFLMGCDLSNDYMGYLSQEPYWGGMFFYNILLVAVFFIYLIRRLLKAKRIMMFTIISIMIGLIIMILDIELSGITQRYFSDFSWMIAVGAVIVWFTLEERLHCREYYWCMVIGVFLCVVLNVWSITIGRCNSPLQEVNPTLFYTLKCLLPLS